MQFYWTNHAKYKMRFYRLSEQTVRSVIRNYKRLEEGIAPETVAYMKQAGSKTRPHEIWVMVSQNKKLNIKNQKHIPKMKKFGKIVPEHSRGTTLKIISAWRYPGITKPGKPLPKEILREIEEAG